MLQCLLHAQHTMDFTSDSTIQTRSRCWHCRDRHPGCHTGHGLHWSPQHPALQEQRGVCYTGYSRTSTIRSPCSIQHCGTSDTARSQLSFTSLAQQRLFTPSMWPVKQLMAHRPPEHLLQSSELGQGQGGGQEEAGAHRNRTQVLMPRPTEPSNTTPCTGAGSTGEPGGWGVFLPSNKAGLGPSPPDKGLGAATHSSSSYLTIHCSSAMARGSSAQGEL